MEKILLIAVQFGVVLFALSLHESAHAWMADFWGDSTARSLGRITLNPLPHIDPMGTVLFPLLMAVLGLPVFGWAKPVPVQVYRLRRPRLATRWVAAAGPLSNLLACGISVLLFLLLRSWVLGNPRLQIIGIILFQLAIINLILAVFNLLPIPPLDGSGVLETLLSGRSLQTYRSLAPYGFLILMAVFYTGILDFLFRPILNWITTLLLT